MGFVSTARVVAQLSDSYASCSNHAHKAPLIVTRIRPDDEHERGSGRYQEAGQMAFTKMVWPSRELCPAMYHAATLKETAAQSPIAPADE